MLVRLLRILSAHRVGLTLDDAVNIKHDHMMAGSGTMFRHPDSLSFS